MPAQPPLGGRYSEAIVGEDLVVAAKAAIPEGLAAPTKAPCCNDPEVEVDPEGGEVVVVVDGTMVFVPDPDVVFVPDPDVVVVVELGGFVVVVDVDGVVVVETPGWDPWDGVVVVDDLALALAIRCIAFMMAALGRVCPRGPVADAIAP
jgi:hypothetical protein